MSKEDIIKDYVIVTALDKNYLKIFKLWLHYFPAELKSILQVITFDKESDELVKQYNITSIFISKKIKSHRDIFVNRLFVMKQILESGKNLIHTDSDAFWINTNLGSIINQTYNLQISIGYGIPKTAVQHWGFSLCCGFFIMHTSETIINFFEEWINDSIKRNDDQIALNEFFLNHQLQWNLKSVTANDGFCSYNNMRVDAISFDVISRSAQNKNIQIYHPFLARTDEKFKVIKLAKQLKFFRDEPFLEKVRKDEIFDVQDWFKVFYKEACKVFIKIKKKF